MKSSKVFLGGLAGLKAVSLIAVLFASENGSTTRKQLERKRDDLKEKFDDMLEDINYKYKTVIGGLYNLISKGKAAKRELKYANDMLA